jgi:predicted RNase H-like HicB family nuclease
MLRYSISIKWSDEDNGFIATVPELPDLSAFGKTQKKALDELKIAAEAYIETLNEAGRTLPVPEKVTVYSGQLRLRLPKGLHAKLSITAEYEGVSLNTYIVSLLSAEHEKHKTINALKELIFDERQRMLSLSNNISTVRNIETYPLMAQGSFVAGNFSTFSGGKN